jgi:3-oxoacyl-[acyl-carrier-protein] synthase II
VQEAVLPCQEHSRQQAHQHPHCAHCCTAHNLLVTPAALPCPAGVKNLVEKGYKKISPFFIPYAITNMGGALLAIDTGFMGPNYSISTACATANYAFVSAANHIRNGDADLMIVGGSEAPIIPVGLGGFVACRALSTRNDQPERASR